MADQWRQEPNKDLEGWNGRNSVQAAIAFAFFSILVWVDLKKKKKIKEEIFIL